MPTACLRRWGDRQGREGGGESWDEAIAIDTAHAFLSLEKRGGGPAVDHVGGAPSLDVVAEVTDEAEAAFDEVGGAQGGAEVRMDAEAMKGEGFLKTLAQAGCGVRAGVVELPGEAEKLDLGLLVASHVPGGAEASGDGGTHGVGEMGANVAKLVLMATLDVSVFAEEGLDGGG